MIKLDLVKKTFNNVYIVCLVTFYDSLIVPRTQEIKEHPLSFFSQQID